MNLSLAELAAITGGSAFGVSPGAAATGFAWDSRQVQKGDLFLAIKGENVDGHDYAAKAFAAGAVAALVERKVEGPCILVPNLVEALAAMGRHYRDLFSGPVVGITGSVGKTITKEFAAAALSVLGPVLKNPGNQNSEYTAPLIWTRATEGHRSAVTEMAMRGFGQIRHLASIAKPTVGVITNVGQAHLELVGSQEGVARAKSELFEELSEGAPAVLWQGDLFLDVLRRRCKGPVYTFGFTPEATCQITHYKPLGWDRAEFEGVLNGETFVTVLPAVGQHIALDAAAGLLAAVCAGAPVKEAAVALRSAQLPAMRMEVIDHKGGTLLMDAYNAGPASMVAALDTLREMPCDGRKMAVIGEMKELGAFTEEGHRQVGRALAGAGLAKVMFYGLPTLFSMEEYLVAGASPKDLEFANSLDDVAEFLGKVQEGDMVLIKGSRSLELEKALAKLGVGP